MAAREYQDLSGGYVNETEADQTAGRVFQDLAGGYIFVPLSGGDDVQAALSGSAMTGGHGTQSPVFEIAL